MNWLNIEATGKKATIRIEGKISPISKTAQLFDAEMTKLEKAGTTEVHIIINSVGGSVIEGIKMYNRIKSSPMTITKEVDHLAASMSAVLASGGTIRAEAKMMFHKPFVPTLENVGATDLRAVATLLENYETEMIAMVAEGTNLTADIIRTHYFKPEDTWLTASKAVDVGIMTAIAPRGGDRVFIEKPYNWLDLDAVASFDLISQKINPKNKNKMEIEVEALANQLGMVAGTTKEQVLAEIGKVKDLKAQNEALKDRITALEASVMAEKKAKVTAFVTEAIAQGKALESERTQLEADANANFDLVKRTFDKIPHKIDLANIGKLASNVSAESKRNWGYNDWCDKDPQGLKLLKKNNPEEYERLIEMY